MSQPNWGARILWTFLALLALTGAAGVSAIMFEDMPFAEEILISTALLSAYCLLALIGWFIWKARKSRLSLLIASLPLAISLLVFLGLTWLDSSLNHRQEEPIAKTAATCLFLGLALMHRGLVIVPTIRRPLGRAVRIIAMVGGAAVFAGMFVIIVIEPDWQFQDAIIRTTLASSLIGIVTTVGVFILERLERATQQDLDDATIRERINVELKCPKCSEAITLKGNKSGSCPSCALRLRVEFEEPRCECGYLLYGLTGDVCPECGKQFRAGASWSQSFDDAD